MKKKVRDQIPNWEKPWEKRNLKEKFQAIIRYKKKAFIFPSILFLTCCVIIGIIVQKWLILVMQLMTTYIFFSALDFIENPEKNIYHHPVFSEAIVSFIGFFVLLIFYFI